MVPAYLGSSPKTRLHQGFKVMARINSKLVPVANATANLDVEWLDNSIVNEEVRGAMNNFMSDLE